jgi:hypothetical protein
MPRVSKTELQIRQAIDALSKIGLDESKADYIRRPALSAIVRHAKEQRKHQREKARIKAEKDAAPNTPRWSVLPDNGRCEQPNGYVKP